MLLQAREELAQLFDESVGITGGCVRDWTPSKRGRAGLQAEYDRMCGEEGVRTPRALGRESYRARGVQPPLDRDGMAPMEHPS